MKSNRWQTISNSNYAWEREALAYLEQRLPDHEPFRGWSNFEFIADDGSINEVDALVLGPAGLYLIEIKSRPGEISGDVHIPTDELEVMAAPETEREALRKSRVGQGKYRDDLLKLRSTCYVTGLNDARFLRASHILPWKDSDNAQRLDGHNGLLLSPHYDALFNDGFISFQDDGHIMVSRRLPPAVIEAFRLPLNFVGADLGQRTKEYLAMHRQKVFQSQIR